MFNPNLSKKIYELYAFITHIISFKFVWIVFCHVFQKSFREGLGKMATYRINTLKPDKFK